MISRFLQIRTLSFLFALFCSIVFSGCGYTTGSLLPKGLDSIYVDNFKNKISPTREISNRRSSYTYIPGLENDITRAVIDSFIYNRGLEVEREDKAALTLQGELVDFRQYPLSYSDNDDVEEFRIEIFVNIELYDNIDGKLMWKEDRFMGQTNYNVSGPQKESQSQAVKDAVKDLAKRIVERTVENW